MIYAIGEYPVVESWEDGLNMVFGQEYFCKRKMEDLVERVSHLNCFGVVVHKLEPKLCVVKCKIS